MNSSGHLLSGVALAGNGEKEEHARIFVARKTAATLGCRGNLLVPHQRAVETRGAALGEQISKNVINGVVRIAEIGPVIAFKIKRLAAFVQDDLAQVILRRLLGA